MNITLCSLDKHLKTFLAIYIIVISLGVTVGLIFIHNTTSLTSKGVVERFKGSENDVDIQENYPKPYSEMLITTHNHIFGMAFIFLSIGIIFNFNSIIKNSWKIFLMTEPLISVILTFGSIWLVRYVDGRFVYVTVLSGILMYLSYYIMAVISFVDLIRTK